MVLETGSLRSGSVWFVDVLLDPFREGEMALPLYMDINPNMEVPPSRPSHLPKAPPPHTITLGVRVSAYGFGGDMLRGRHKHAQRKAQCEADCQYANRGSDLVPFMSCQDISSFLMHLESIQPFRLSLYCTGTVKQHCKTATKTDPNPEGGAFPRIFGAIYFMSAKLNETEREKGKDAVNHPGLDIGLKKLAKGNFGVSSENLNVIWILADIIKIVHWKNR